MSKIALVTGGTRGIGEAISKKLHNDGHTVIVNYSSNEEAAKKFSDENNIEAFKCDVGSYESCSEMISKIFEKYQKIDILVNNAGNNRPEHFTKIKKENMEYLVELNMKAAFNVAQLCSKKMVQLKNRKKVGGSIINMSSQLGRVGAPIRSVYNMTKFGLEGLTRGMALELGKYNIRVNSVCPTFVETPMVKAFFKDKKFKAQMIRNIPLGRVAQESDVSTAVAFLAADSSNSITGTSLMVDGGWTAQ